jgi:hypothetical protein
VTRRKSPAGSETIRASRSLSLRRSADGQVFVHATSGRPVVILVRGARLADAASVAIARVWWAERVRAGGHGIGAIAPGSGSAPHYKFKVTLNAAGALGLRLTATSPSGEVSIPERGTPPLPILEQNPEQCALVASSMIQSAIDRYGIDAAAAEPSGAQLAALEATFADPKPGPGAPDT